MRVTRFLIAFAALTPLSAGDALNAANAPPAAACDPVAVARRFDQLGQANFLIAPSPGRSYSRLPPRHRLSREQATRQDR